VNWLTGPLNAVIASTDTSCLPGDEVIAGRCYSELVLTFRTVSDMSSAVSDPNYRVFVALDLHVCLHSTDRTAGVYSI